MLMQITLKEVFLIVMVNAIGMIMAQMFLNNDFDAACAFLISNVTNAEVLEELLAIFLENIKASKKLLFLFYIDLIPIEHVLNYQDNNGTIFTAIAQILIQYGGLKLLTHNKIVNCTLSLVCALFACGMFIFVFQLYALLSWYSHSRCNSVRDLSLFVEICTVCIW